MKVTGSEIDYGSLLVPWFPFSSVKFWDLMVVASCQEQACINQVAPKKRGQYKDDGQGEFSNSP